jgi:TonB family protein
MRTSSLRTALVLLVAPLAAWAQFGSSGRSSATVPLNVRVVYSDDRAVQTRVTVQLLAGGEPIENGVTNEEGALHFSAVPPGEYQLEVSGPGIQTTRSAAFTLYRDQHFHMETVTVRPEPLADEKKAGAPGTVSAASMNIPEPAKDAFRKGAEALKKNDLTEARQEFERAVKEYPKYSAAYDGLGIVLARMGDTEEALADLHKSVELDDHNIQACVNLARLAYRSGKAGDAESALNKGLLADPKSVEMLAMLSDIQLRTGQYREAVATEHKIHLLPHAQYGSAHLIAGVALQAQQRWKDAGAEYELYLKEEPNGPRAEEARKRLKFVQYLERNGVPPALRAANLPATPPGVYRVGGDVSAPRAISIPAPQLEAAEKRIYNYDGQVLLMVQVSKEGKVDSANVVRSSQVPELDQKAVEAVKKWIFEPAQKGGQPVAVLINVEVPFHSH